MGWRNRKPRSTLGSIIKRGDSLITGIAELRKMCFESDMFKETDVLYEMFVSAMYTLTNAVWLWLDWYGDLPSDLANRVVVSQIIEALKEQQDDRKTTETTFGSPSAA